MKAAVGIQEGKVKSGKRMDLRTTQEVDLPGFGALLVEEGEVGDQGNTQVSNFGCVCVGGAIHERKESTRKSRSG